MNDPQFDVGQKPGDPTLNPYEAGFSPEPPQKSRGCFFYGCIIATVLAVLTLICLGVLFYFAYSYYSRAIQEYTSPTPAEIPTVSLPADQQKALDDRIDAFKKALDEGEAAELVLTADEVNALIGKEKDPKIKVFVSIEGDEVSGKMSVPLGEFGIPLAKDRYFNGSGTFNVAIEDGELVVIARELEANGKKLPPEAKAQLAKENLAKNFMDKPEIYQYVRKFESVKVKDGKIYIKSKARAKIDFDEDKKDEDKPKADDTKTEEKAPDSAEPAPKAEPGEPEKKAEPAPKAEPQPEPKAEPDSEPQKKAA